MSHVTYTVVEHDGGWAYKVGDVFSETFPTHEAAHAAARQKLVSEILPKGIYKSDPLSFNIWLEVPAPWNRTAFVEHMRSTGIGVVASVVTIGDRPRFCCS